MTASYSPELQAKIDRLKAARNPVSLGRLNFASQLLLAPMASICNSPFRLLMEELGAGGTVSELVSCHGIIYGNQKTLKMLSIDPREKNVGIQLFGEDGPTMAESAKVAQEYSPKFIDINMGCPVRKVVTKGGGSALLRDTSKLGEYFAQIKKAINVPLTIKIRTGWEDDALNADEVIRIASEEGIEFVAVHGRTRNQQYRGKANWEYLEKLSIDSPLPLIGNGDLHTHTLVKQRLSTSHCSALMLARGPLRDPFIFLTPYGNEENDIEFFASDTLEVIQRYYALAKEYTERPRTLSVQMKKHIVWWAAGYPNVAKFRQRIFQTPETDDLMKLAEDYFLSLGKGRKQINHLEPFMTSGHG